MDHLTIEFAEMNKTVDFLSNQYDDDFISQLQLINTRNAQQSVNIKKYSRIAQQS